MECGPMAIRSQWVGHYNATADSDRIRAWPTGCSRVTAMGRWNPLAFANQRVAGILQSQDIGTNSLPCAADATMTGNQGQVRG
jgi:hypothetical protein